MISCNWYSSTVVRVLWKRSCDVARAATCLRLVTNLGWKLSYQKSCLTCGGPLGTHRISPRWAVSVSASNDSSGKSVSVKPGIAPNTDGPSKTPAITCSKNRKQIAMKALIYNIYTVYAVEHSTGSCSFLHTSHAISSSTMHPVSRSTWAIYRMHRLLFFCRKRVMDALRSKFNINYSTNLKRSTRYVSYFINIC